MRLQVNLHGAWRNVPDQAGGLDEGQLMAAALATHPEASGFRILHGVDDFCRPRVIWLWSPEAGWHRPRWYVETAQ